MIESINYLCKQFKLFINIYLPSCDMRHFDVMPELVPEPAFISTDDYSAADPARRRLVQKSRFIRLRSAFKREKQPAIITEPSVTVTTTNCLDDIYLDSTKLDTSDEHTEKYQWAVVYENQRG